LLPVQKTTPLALDAYEELAEAYAAKIDTKAHNAYCERPGTLSLLPPVEGLDVLDAGCGPGAYAELLARQGARVVGVDASPRMLALAKARAGSGATFYRADLGGTLPFLEDEQFHLVLAALVLDYIADWTIVLGEFHRVLKPGGLLVFSIGHPAFDAVYFRTEKYAETEQVSSVWKGFGVRVEMPTHRRPLSAVFNPVMRAGFELVEILEPQPTEDFKKAEPAKFESLKRQPCFLCVKVRKPAC
jgi:ubiquinone/menaquinone biosynthesis C-methylase UbiE